MKMLLKCTKITETITIKITTLNRNNYRDFGYTPLNKSRETPKLILNWSTKIKDNLNDIIQYSICFSMFYMS